MVILRLDGRIRMVTKGYRKGVYDWVRLVKGWIVWAGTPEADSRRAAAANTKITATSKSGLGSLLKIFHATKLIDQPSARGDPRTNLSAREASWIANLRLTRRRD